MTRHAMSLLLSAAIVLPLAAAGAQVSSARSEEAVLQRFRQAVDGYVSFHRRIELSLPALQVTSDPQQMWQAVEARTAAIRAARSGAVMGDLFTAEVGDLLRVRIQQVIVEGGYTVADVLANITEDPPADAPRPVVNGPFPWVIGAMMPPDILNVLPPLPTELQYRLVDRDLVLVDLEADLVVDILPRALPAPETERSGR
jgi:hypothetical protein